MQRSCGYDRTVFIRLALFACLLFVGAVAAIAEVRVDTEQLQIVAPDGMEGFAERVRSQFPVLIGEVERALGGRFHRRLIVRVARGDDDFARELERPASQVAALARPARAEIVLKASAIRATTGESFPAIVRHELVHVILYDLVGSRRVPRWFDEGLAEVVGGRHPFGSAYELARGIVSDSIMTLDELTEEFPENPDAFALAYRQSENFVMYLRSQIGMKGIRRVIELTAGGSSVRDAIEEVSGVPLDEHEAQWRHDLEASSGAAMYTLLAAWWWEILIVGVAFGTLVAVWRHRIRRRRILDEMDADEAEDGPG